MAIEGNSPKGMTIHPELEFKTAGMETDLIGKAICGGKGWGDIGQQPRRDDYYTIILQELEFKASGMKTDQIGNALCGVICVCVWGGGGHGGHQPRGDDHTSSIRV